MSDFFMAGAEIAVGVLGFLVVIGLATLVLPWLTLVSAYWVYYRICEQRSRKR